MTIKYTWSADENDELWQHDIFDKIEDCISDAITNYGYTVGDTIAVGELNPFKPSVNADFVLEQLETDAYEEVGEVSENWLTSDRGSIKELSDRLTKCVNDWLKETGQEPTFYGIKNIKVVDINDKK